MSRALLGAVVGGAVGAVIWAAVSFYGNMEVGWIAWGIGVLVGLGVRKAMKPEQLNVRIGLLAGAVALLAVAVGKYASVYMAIESARAQPITMTDELAISYLADDVIKERLDSGGEVAWPHGEPGEELDSEDDYPADVWAEGKSRWSEMGPGGQGEYKVKLKTQIRENFDRFAPEMQMQGFASSFEAIDLLFLGLAVYTAFRLGSSTVAVKAT